MALTGAVLCRGPAPICPCRSFSVPRCPKSPSPNFGIPQGQGQASLLPCPQCRWAQPGSVGAPGSLEAALPAVLTYLGECQQLLLQEGCVLSLGRNLRCPHGDSPTPITALLLALQAWHQPLLRVYLVQGPGVSSQPPGHTVMTLNKFLPTFWPPFYHLNQKGSWLGDGRVLPNVGRGSLSGLNRSPCTALLPQLLLQE